MPNDVIVLVTEKEWKTKKEAERETDTHPCNHWAPATCDCKGACSCHWLNLPQEVAQTISTLKGLNSRFYWLCFYAGIGSSAHGFIEFNGVMKVYIEMLEAGVRAGIHPQDMNEHNGVPLPVAGHQVSYLAEKLRCLFGPMIDTNPEARAILLKELFGIVEK